jgi:predicted MFS family arabinose efflux permease
MRTARNQRGSDGGWILATVGVAIIVCVAIFGKLNVPGPYATVAATVGLVAIVMVAAGLYEAVKT